MPTFRGYNGFPDLETYDFQNTGVNLTELWYSQGAGAFANEYLRCNLFRAMGTGTYVDFNAICTNGPLINHYIDDIDYNDPSTWLQVYEGVMLKKVEGTYPNFTFWFQFSKRDLIQYSWDSSVDPPGPPTYEYPAQEVPIVIDCSPSPITPELFTPRMALLYFDSLYCPYDNHYLQEIGDDGYYKWIVGNGNKASAGSVYWDDAITPGPVNIQIEVQDGVLHELGRYNWGIGNPITSGDNPNSWWCYSSGISRVNGVFLTSWGGNPIGGGGYEDDPSGPGGGEGEYDGEGSDAVPFDGIPNTTAVGSGFIKIWDVPQADMEAIQQFMFSDSYLDNVSTFLQVPYDYIISLMINPCDPTVGSISGMKIGGVLMPASGSRPLTSQYKTFDCGNVTISEKYGGFLDYNGFTDVSIYLPFCGTHSLDANIVMGSTVNLKYVVDFLTGDCIARVHVRNNHGVNAETYFFEGNCTVQIPMCGRDYSAQSVGWQKAAFSLLNNNVGGLIDGVNTALAPRKQAAQRAGSIGRNVGLMSQYQPYIMIERPTQSFAQGTNHCIGRPSNTGGYLSSYSGYTEVEAIIENNIVATNEELDEIEQLLKSGVYL